MNVWSNEFGKRDGINCVAVNPGPVATGESHLLDSQT